MLGDRRRRRLDGDRGRHLVIVGAGDREAAGGHNAVGQPVEPTARTRRRVDAGLELLDRPRHEPLHPSEGVGTGDALTVDRHRGRVALHENRQAGLVRGQRHERRVLVGGGRQLQREASHQLPALAAVGGDQLGLLQQRVHAHGVRRSDEQHHPAAPGERSRARPRCEVGAVPGVRGVDGMAVRVHQMILPPKKRQRMSGTRIGPLTQSQITTQITMKSITKVENGTSSVDSGHHLELEQQPDQGALVDAGDEAEQRRPVLLPPELLDQVVDDLPAHAEHGHRGQDDVRRLVVGVVGQDRRDQQRDQCAPGGQHEDAGLDPPVQCGKHLNLPRSGFRRPT